VQLLIYLACHPSWEVRKVAYDAMEKVLSSSSGLAEDTLFLFTDWLSLVGERLSMLKQGYAPVDLSVSDTCIFLILSLPWSHLLKAVLLLHLNPVNLHILCADISLFKSVIWITLWIHNYHSLHILRSLSSACF
jgi:hypothetical protein